MTDYMLDTSAIGEIEDGAVDPRTLYSSSDRFYITHIQEDEVEAAGTFARFLERVFDVVDAESKSTESMVWDVSKWGRAKWDTGTHYEKLKETLSPDDGNEIKDALIAETAIESDYTLVAHDGELQYRVNEDTPGTAISLPEFRAEIEDR